MSFRQELGLRVIYALLQAPVRLAFTFRLSAKELRDLVQMAYYHETKRQGMKMSEVSELMQVSMRKVAQLSKQLKLNFIQVEQEQGLPRRIEFLLWAGPLSEARIRQALSAEEPDDIEIALAQLSEQGRILELDSDSNEKRRVFEVVRSEFRLVDSNWMARLDALSNLTDNVAQIVHRRFFLEDARAFARTINLRIKRSSMGRLRQIYEDTLWPQLVRLDTEAKGEEDAETVNLSILWAPSVTEDPTDTSLPEASAPGSSDEEAPS